MSEVLFAGNIADGLPAAAEDSLQLKLNLAIGFRNDPPLATPSSRIVTGMEDPDDDITMGQMRQKMCAEKRQEEQFALSKKGEGPLEMWNIQKTNLFPWRVCIFSASNPSLAPGRARKVASINGISFETRLKEAAGIGKVIAGEMAEQGLSTSVL